MYAVLLPNRLTFVSFGTLKLKELLRRVSVNKVVKKAEIVVKFRTEKKNSCDVNVKLEYSCER